MKKTKIALFTLVAASGIISLSSCLKSEKTDTGFSYILENGNIKIVGVPAKESIVIPEYIDNRLVTAMGGGFMASWNRSNADVVKKLTICHDIVYDDISLFPNLTNLTFNNVASCFLTYEESELIIPDYIGRDDGLDINVSLIASNRFYDATNFKVTTIYIPEYVTTIESGAFSMLIGVTLKTEYKEKPAGWADDFNSNLEVEWGVEINTETDK